MSRPIWFKTERLWLKPTHVEDAAFLRQLMNTPGWLRNIGDRQIHSLEDAQAYIEEKVQPEYQRLGFGAYTLVCLEDGAKIGVCGLYDREGIDGVDIGFALLPEYEKQGYAWEAANYLKQMAFGLFGLKKISGITQPGNTTSQRLLEKLGLLCQGTVCLSPEETPLLLYVLHFEI